MAAKLSLAVAGAAAVLAGCGTQARVNRVTAHSQLGRHSQHARPHSGDYEGPNKPSIRNPLPARSYRVTLTGRSVVPRVPGTGAVGGIVALRPKTHEVCWGLGRPPRATISTAAFGHVRARLTPTSASIHAGAKGANGPLIVPLGTRYMQHGCTPVPPVVLNSIAAAPRLYYLTLVTGQLSKGVLRAQL